jgi:hypothetical protein
MRNVCLFPIGPRHYEHLRWYTDNPIANQLVKFVKKGSGVILINDRNEYMKVAPLLNYAMKTCDGMEVLAPSSLTFAPLPF